MEAPCAQQKTRRASDEHTLVDGGNRDTSHFKLDLGRSESTVSFDTHVLDALPSIPMFPSLSSLLSLSVLWRAEPVQSTLSTPHAPIRRRRPSPLVIHADPSPICTPQKRKLSLKSIRNVFSNTQPSGDTPRLPPDTPIYEEDIRVRQIASLFPRVTSPVAAVQGFPAQADLVQRPYPPRSEQPIAKWFLPISSAPTHESIDIFSAPVARYSVADHRPGSRCSRKMPPTDFLDVDIPDSYIALFSGKDQYDI